MNLLIFPNATAFLSVTRASLDLNEAANNLMYGLALRLESKPEAFQRPPYKWPPFLAAVTDEGGLAAAALMTPPYNFLVFSPRPEAEAQPAWELLADALQAQGLHPPGTLGPCVAALAFARTWSRRTGMPFRLGMSERVYELRRVIAPPHPGGALRLAGEADLDLLAGWVHAFWLEAVPREAQTREDARRVASYKVADGDFHLWDDGGPVALAGRSRKTPHGYCIGPVYTPPERRRRGYASAATAALSQLLLDSGAEFTCLFTDLSNPTSNSIYQKIGYRGLGDFNEYVFGNRE